MALDMEEKPRNKVLWDLASKDGIALGMLSVACLALKQLLSGWEGGASNLVGALVWAIQFFGAIFLLRAFMKKFTEGNDEATSLDTYMLGKRICLFSSLILAVATTALVVYYPDNLLTRQFNMMMEQYSSMMDAASRETLAGTTLSDSPGVIFFSQFIYAYVYGLVLSAILSRRIPGPKTNPQ